VVAVTIMSYSNIIVAVKCKIQLVEVIVFTEATVVETTEAASSVASNVATAMRTRVTATAFSRLYYTAVMYNWTDLTAASALASFHLKVRFSTMIAYCLPRMNEVIGICHSAILLSMISE